MALSLADLRRVKATLPPRLLFYGPHGLGKTTLASEFSDPVFIQVEEGTPSDLELDSFGVVTSFEAVMEALAALYTEEHRYRTVVIDSADRLEPLVWQHVCAAKNWEGIEAPGYGKGYIEADRYWREMLDGLNALRRDRGMAVIIIAHSEIERFDDPTTVSYSRYDIRLHKRARAMLQDEADAILMINQEATIKKEEQGFNKSRAHAEGGMHRWIFTEGRPSFNAKNRFGMPPKLQYRKGEGFAVLAPFFPGAEPAADPAPDTKQTKSNGNGKQAAA